MNIFRCHKKTKENHYEKNGETTANRYAFKCLSCTMLIIVFVWVLDILNIFMVDRTVTSTACFLSLVVYLVAGLVFKNNDISKHWMKYFLLVCLSIIIAIVMTTLTFHTVLVCVLPIVFSSMYSSNRMRYCTFLLTICNVIISVYVGYYFGICDANMVLLSGKPMAAYLNDNNEFLLTKVNDNVPWTLFLFFVVPRSIICILFSAICKNIAQIINLNVQYTQKMEFLAEKDVMTGLYNRSKYLTMKADDYLRESNIAIIFWDINYLKKINDSLGHEHGDQMILTVADSIKQVSSPTEMSYRIGGDEFVMVISDGDENAVINKMQEWETIFNRIQKQSSNSISVSVGYAYGAGKDIDCVIRKADQMMYANKRAYHSSH